MNEFNTKLIKKVQRQSLTSVIHDQLEDMILSGRLKPGERINESRLSALLEVSRAPIREACRQLEKNGMVEIITRRGTFVAEIDLNEVQELYDIRASMDALATEKAAEYATPKDLEDFRYLLGEMKDAVEKKEIQKYFQCNLDFHRKIVLTSKNNNLFSLIEGIYNKASLCRKTNLYYPDRVLISFKQHNNIFKAIEAGNPEKASKLMKHHILDAKDALLKSLSAVN